MAVVRITADSNNQRVVSLSHAPNNDWNTVTGTEAIGEESHLFPAAYRNNAQMSSAGALNLNTWMIVFSVFDGTNHTMYINNVAQTPVASTGSFSFDLISIGADDGGGSHLNGEVAEAVVYTQALSSTDRASLFSYLNAKWNFVATTTPVTATRSTTWNVVATTTPVTATRSTTWNVVATTTPVTATRSTTWNVAAAPSGGCSQHTHLHHPRFHDRWDVFDR